MIMQTRLHGSSVVAGLSSNDSMRNVRCAGAYYPGLESISRVGKILPSVRRESWSVESSLSEEMLLHAGRGARERGSALICTFPARYLMVMLYR